MCNYITEEVSTFIDGLDPIEDERTRTLYSFGLRLRRKFGLSHYRLYAALSRTNQQRCLCPLEEIVVAQVGWSVDETLHGGNLEHLVLGHRLTMAADETLGITHVDSN